MPRKYARRPRKVKRASKAKKEMANKDTHAFKIKLTGSIVPVQGVTVSNYVYLQVSPAPGAANNANSLALTNSAEFALYTQMFDQFRVKSVMMRVIPRATTVEAVQLALQQDNAFITAGKGVYYTCIDRDGQAPSRISSIKKYSSHKVHKMTSGATRTYSVSYPGKDTWFDCQDKNALPDVQKSIGLWGGITMYGESFPEGFATVLNQAWGDLEVTYNVVYRGKALVQLQVANDGAVTVSQPDPDNLETIQVFQSTDEVEHLGSIDPSGNLIT